VSELFETLRATASASAPGPAPDLTWPVPVGESLPIGDYYPFQNDLPRVYGVGEAGLPASAPPQRRAQALQLKGYLLLFEQYLGDISAQLANLNTFFSGSATCAATYFVRPLLDLPDIRHLLRRFQADGDWQAFSGDPDNPYVRALRAAAESPQALLDRRNRMLDHLLARQGEDMVAWGQELHRWIRREWAAAQVDAVATDSAPLWDFATPADLANGLLIRAKAAFLADLPELAARRLQGPGNPLWSQPSRLDIAAEDGGLRWRLGDSDGVLLQGSTPLPQTQGGAAIAAEEAVLLGARAGAYEHVPEDGGRRVLLLDRSAGQGSPLGEAPALAEDEAAAVAAIAALAATLAGWRISDSMTPLERRVAHLMGIRLRTRRPLIRPLDAHFEVFGAPDALDWRLWEQPGHGGRMLLRSPAPLADAAAATAVVETVVRYGGDPWNYRLVVDEDGARYELWSPAGERLALGMDGIATRAEAEALARESADALYRDYSAEGLLLVEHILLRPRQDSDALLRLRAADGNLMADPYSHRLSLIFPSGYARDFSAADAADAGRRPAPPHRFRDPELRRHAERTIARACPVHLRPHIFWVDRAAAGTPAAVGSFDDCELRHADWQETLLIPGAEASAMDAARNAMVLSLSAIAAGGPP
jgi:hypothetical protein